MTLLSLDEQREVRDYITALEYTLNEVDKLAAASRTIEEQSRILKKHISILIAHKPYALVKALTEDPPTPPPPRLSNINLTRSPSVDNSLSHSQVEGYRPQPYTSYYSEPPPPLSDTNNDTGSN